MDRVTIEKVIDLVKLYLDGSLPKGQALEMGLPCRNVEDFTTLIVRGLSWFACENAGLVPVGTLTRLYNHNYWKLTREIEYIIKELESPPKSLEDLL